MRSGQRGPGRHIRVAVMAGAMVALGFSVATRAREGAESEGSISRALPNNFPHLNASGLSATFSTQGFVDLTGEYFQAQGTNGRSCVTCHIAAGCLEHQPRHAAGCSSTQTGGTHPVFNPLDANNPDMADVSTVEARRAGVQHDADPRRVPPGRRSAGRTGVGRRSPSTTRTGSRTSPGSCSGGA